MVAINLCRRPIGQKSEWEAWREREDRLLADLRLTYESAVEEHRGCEGLGGRVREGEERIAELTRDLEAVRAELAAEQGTSAQLADK